MERKKVMVLEEKVKQDIIKEMEDVLEFLGYSYTEQALGTIVDEWFKNKKELIELMSRHPNYVKDKFYIQFDRDIEREINTDVLDIMKKGLYNEADRDTREELHKNKNKVYQEKLEEERNVFMPVSLVNFLDSLSNYKVTSIDEDFIETYTNYLGSYNLDIKLVPGMKTSRAVNRICSKLGINNVKSYNKYFATYADALSPLKIKRHTVLSCHPLDYLLMSNGNSWTSCHTINKFTKEDNGFGGCHASGTISYMLDSCSLVYYEVDADYNGNSIELQPKIVRQMYHYGDRILVQGRLYPQKNDGDELPYTERRKIVQKVFADLLGEPNYWHNKKGTSACKSVIDTAYGSTNYDDYFEFGSCNVSYIKGEEDETKNIIVGHAPICIECGDRHSEEGNINCCKDPSCEIYNKNSRSRNKGGTIY